MTTVLVPLAELCQMDRRHVRSGDEGALNLPFVGVEHVVAGNGEIDFGSASRVGTQKSAAFRFDARHVLYGKLRPYLNKVAIPDFAGKCSTELIPLLAREGVDRDYLAHLLRRRETVDFVMAAVTGSRMPRADMKVLLSMRVPLPPLEEQRRIVAILNRAAKIQRLRAQAAERLREFVPALFAKMFDREKDRADWSIAKVEDLVTSTRGKIRTGPFGSQLRHSEFTEDGVPVLGIDNVVTNRFRWTKARCLPREKYERFTRYRVYPDDVLITIMGTTGRACVAPSDLPECMSTKHLCILTLDRSLVEPTYVWGSLLFDSSVRNQTRVHAQGQIMEGWNSKIVRNLRLRIPPLRLQRDFVRMAHGELSIWRMGDSGLGPASELGRSLMTRLLDGKRLNE